jgi:pimeloyl-ACP methyl ester carboxylesterase
MTPSGGSETLFLNLPDGCLAFDDQGSGPLIIAIPAMLDLRAELRLLAPRLVDAGFRVVTIDQRGMGESSGRWPDYGSTPMARDLMALIRHLDAGPALVYGTSNGAAAAVYLAAEAPELVRGLVLAAPFVRDGKGSWLQRQLMQLMRISWLALPIYMSYYPKWEPRLPRVDDFDSHLANLRANLAEPGRRGVIDAYIRRQSHRDAEARIGQVAVPSLVIMGTADVDWPDPRAEAEWLADRLPDSELLLLEGAGHHPHVEFPDEIAAAVVDFAERLGDERAAAVGSR